MQLRGMTLMLPLRGGKGSDSCGEWVDEEVVGNQRIIQLNWESAVCT